MSEERPMRDGQPELWFVGRSRTCLDCDGDGCRACGHLGFIPGELIGWDEDYEAAKRDAAEVKP